MYTLANAKHDYKEGWIDGFSLVRQDRGWVIEVWKYDPEGIKRQICTARRETRVFKTLDAAAAAVEEIGFSTDYLTGTPIASNV